MARKHLGIGSLQAIGGLEPVVHSITTPDGEDIPMAIGDWEADEEAPGGFMAARGRIARDLIRDHGDIYRYGARFRSTLASDGFCVYSGRLLDPAPDGTISSRGTGTLLEKNAGRRLYMSVAYKEWSDIAGDPFDDLSHAQGGQAPDGNITINVGDGVIGFILADKSSLVGGDLSRAAFWAPNNNLRSLHFTLHPDGDRGDFYHFYVHTTKGPSGGGKPLTPRGAPGGIAMVPGTPTSHNIQLLGEDDDLVAMSLVADPGIPNQTSAPRFRVRVRDLALFGIAEDETFSVSDLMRDICGEFGIRTGQVDPTDVTAVPLDMHQGSFAENLMTAMMLADWRYLILDEGGQPSCDLGPWDKRTWRVVDSEANVALQPLDRFNVVQVPFRYASGNVTDIAEVRLKNDFGLGFDNVFSDLALDEPLPTRDQAERIGDRILEIVSSKRVGGTVITAEVIDEQDNRVSAQRVRAGDTLILEYFGGMRARVKHKHISDTEVSFDLDDKLAALEKLLALRARRLQLTGTSMG